jgi:hypothetical protein
MQDKGLVWYEDEYCYYFWKAHGIASSFGQGPCFLDVLEKSAKGGNTKIKEIFDHLDTTFGREDEYGLLNRLDNDTA